MTETTNLDQQNQEALENQNPTLDMNDDEFHNYLKTLVENPDLQVIANVVVNLLSEQTGQIQTNVVHAVFLNTLLEVLIKKGLLTKEEFEETYKVNLEKADLALQDTFNQAKDEISKASEAQ